MGNSHITKAKTLIGKKISQKYELEKTSDKFIEFHFSIYLMLHGSYSQWTNPKLTHFAHNVQFWHSAPRFQCRGDTMTS
jgi:hypothetical protein